MPTYHVHKLAIVPVEFVVDDANSTQEAYEKNRAGGEIIKVGDTQGYRLAKIEVEDSDGEVDVTGEVITADNDCVIDHPLIIDLRRFAHFLLFEADSTKRAYAKANLGYIFEVLESFGYPKAETLSWKSPNIEKLVTRFYNEAMQSLEECWEAKTEATNR